MANLTSRLQVIIGADADELRDTLDSVKGRINSAAKTMRRAGTAMTAGLTVPLAAAGAKALQTSAKFERYEKALGAIMGSSRAARDEIQRLRKAAQNPGLGFQQAVSSSVQLQSIGFSAQQARESLSEFGNALALSGGKASELDEVTKQFQNIVSQDRVLLEDLNVLRERIPVINQALQQAFGTKNAERIREMGVGGKEFVKRVTEALSTFQRVEGGLSNSIDNLRINFTTVLKEVGDAINDTFDVSGILSSFNSLLGQMAERIRTASPFTRTLVTTFAGLLAVVGPLLVGLGAILPVLTNIGTIFGTVASAATAAWAAITGPIGLTVAALTGLGAAIYFIVENWQAVKEATVAALDFMIDTVRNGAGLIRELFTFVFQRVADTILSVLADITGGIQTALESVGVDTFSDEIETAKEALDGLIDEKTIQQTKQRGREFKRAFANNLSTGAETLYGAGEDIVSGFMSMFKRGRKAAETQIDKTKEATQGLGGGGGVGGEGIDSRAREGMPTLRPIDPKATSGLKVTRKEIEKLQLAMNKAKKEVGLFRKKAQQAFGDATQGFISNVNNLIGKGIDNLLNMKALTKSLPPAFSTMVSLITSFMRQLIKSFIQAIIKALVLRAVAAAISGGTSEIASAGVGAVQGATSLAGVGMAEGGVVSSATSAIVGEGPRINRKNPEVVAPLDKLKSMTGGMKQRRMTMDNNVTFRLRGRDLIGSIENTENELREGGKPQTS